jgi:DNA repair protein RadC
MHVLISRLPHRDRPRERLSRQGAATLTNAELVALVIRSGGKGTSAIAAGQGLLAEHGGVSRLAHTPLEEMARSPAMGSAKAASVVAAFELGRRAAAAEDAAVRMRDPGDVAALVRRHVLTPEREESFVVVLGPSGRLMKVERLTVGTDQRCLVDPRDVLTAALRHRGRAFALAHTHPGGDPAPSGEDVRTTEVVRTAAEAVGLRMLDHVIVAGGRWASVPLGGTPIQ